MRSLFPQHPGLGAVVRARGATARACAVVAALGLAAGCGGAQAGGVPPGTGVGEGAGIATGAARSMARVEADHGELRGMASWYGPGFAGRPTASGERFNPRAFTAAHRTLPFGTLVRVVRVDTRQWVDVRINDRGPYAHGRVIDLSEAAAAEFDLIDSGVTEVWIEILQWPTSDG